MSLGKQNIHFHYLYKDFPFSHRNRLKSFLADIFNIQGREVEQLNYIFCDDVYLLQINQHYLKHNTLTDIITFELSSKEQALVSDVYISIERVRENAMNFNSSFKRELHRVIFHGSLHLLGYNDKKPDEKELMRAMEEEFLKDYFVPRKTVSL